MIFIYSGKCMFLIQNIDILTLFHTNSICIELIDQWTLHDRNVLTE